VDAYLESYFDILRY